MYFFDFQLRNYDFKDISPKAIQIEEFLQTQLIDNQKTNKIEYFNQKLMKTLVFIQ